MTFDFTQTSLCKPVLKDVLQVIDKKSAFVDAYHIQGYIAQVRQIKTSFYYFLLDNDKGTAPL